MFIIFVLPSMYSFVDPFVHPPIHPPTKHPSIHPPLTHLIIRKHLLRMVTEDMRLNGTFSILQISVTHDIQNSVYHLRVSRNRMVGKHKWRSIWRWGGLSKLFQLQYLLNLGSSTHISLLLSFLKSGDQFQENIVIARTTLTPPK